MKDMPDEIIADEEEWGPYRIGPAQQHSAPELVVRFADVLVVKPGDKLLIKLPVDTTKDDAYNLKKMFEETLKGVPVAVLVGDAEIVVVPSDKDPECE